eukprot:TRINITY_DN5923_c0_g1_i3.p1 TRINITY_DN5923_c0_g1~~TRINITY_DN5923_c0_g1_i3.p1  ORF type:complete len:188 (-),score=23.39 TRINITY_DN5923_c0_g1_i3:262-825(-)
MNRLTGRSPFAKRHHDDVWTNNKQGILQETRSLAAVLCDAGLELLNSMLNKDPSKRPTFSEVLEHPYLRNGITPEQKTSDLIEKNSIKLKACSSVESEEKEEETDESEGNSGDQFYSVSSEDDHMKRSEASLGELDECSENDRPSTTLMSKYQTLEVLKALKKKSRQCWRFQMYLYMVINMQHVLSL